MLWWRPSWISYTRLLTPFHLIKGAVTKYYIIRHFVAVLDRFPLNSKSKSVHTYDQLRCHRQIKGASSSSFEKCWVTMLHTMHYTTNLNNSAGTLILYFVDEFRVSKTFYASLNMFTLHYTPYSLNNITYLLTPDANTSFRTEGPILFERWIN